MNISRLSSVLVIVTAILCSCSIDEGYDFDNYNPEMTFFVNGLNLKLGDIAPVTIDSLLALAQHTKFMNHLRTDEQGNYYFGYSDYLTLTHQSPGTQGPCPILKVPAPSLSERFPLLSRTWNGTSTR